VTGERFPGWLRAIWYGAWALLLGLASLANAYTHDPLWAVLWGLLALADAGVCGATLTIWAVEREDARR